MCLVYDYSCAYFKVFKAMKSSDIHQQALLYYDKTLVVLYYAYAKIYRNVVVDGKWDFFKKKEQNSHKEFCVKWRFYLQLNIKLSSTVTNNHL